MKVLLDMNLAPAWVPFLSEAHIPATHWSTVGAADATDTEVMQYAVAHGFIVLTHDLDFGIILAASRGKKPSVVQIRSDDLRPEFIGRAIISALRSADAELEAGAFISVEPGRTRLRILPLGRS